MTSWGMKRRDASRSTEGKAILFGADVSNVPGRQGGLPDQLAAPSFGTYGAGLNLDVFRAIGLLARDDSVLPVLEKLHYHQNWQVRDAVVCTYEELHRRGVVGDNAKLLDLVDDVLITCDSFQPRFKLKEDLVRARRKFEQIRAATGDAS